jgi:protein-disulfide isomerase
MKTFFLFLIIGGVAVAAEPPKPKATPTAAKAATFDKAAFEAYVRHLNVWPSSISMEIGNPKPSELPGFLAVVVKASQGKATNEETFYVSKDYKKIIRGTVYDSAQNPFKADLDKLKTDGRPALGTAGAPVVLVEFTDFECPYCREEASKLRANLLKDFPKEVHFYFMDFPLEQMHPWAKAAAMAGQCIFKQNADVFWEYHDWIFEHQTEITADNLTAKVLEFTKYRKVDNLQLGRCMETKATEAEVDRTMALGKNVDVTATPTIFVNGRKLSGAVDWPDLKRIIEYEIGYQKTAKNAGEDCGCEVKLPMPPGMKSAGQQELRDH